MFERLNQRMTARSAALLLTIDNRLDRILQGWLLIFGLLAAARIALSPHPTHGAAFSTILSYVLVLLAPFVSTLLALRWFADGDRQPQPATRLARVGRWRSVDRDEALRHPLYG